MALVLLAMLACAAFAANNAPFFFIQLADTQMGFTNKNVDMIPEIANFSKAVEHINRLKPAFVLISGDLVNTAHNPKQIRAFWSIAKTISPDVPLYLVPGNHDVTNTPTADDIRSYTKLMGKDHYSFSYNGSEFVIIDSCLISDKSDNGLRDAQLKWFETELAAARARNPAHIFVCDHHPWFLKDPQEPSKYENVPLAHRGVYLDLMNRYGVEYALSGHLHHELIGHDRDLTLLADGPVSKSTAKPPVVGLRIVRVYKDRVERQFYGLDKVPEQANM